MDMICWIMGEAPSTIICQAHSFIPEIGALNDVDQVGIMMKFPSGAIAQVDLNRNAFYGYDQRLEIFGSKGMLETKNEHQTLVNMHGVNGVGSGCIKRSFPTRYKDSYILEFEHFLNVFK
ncbi:myo-inositol 2-dehydrogenase-like, partial [Anneissia japonica]|uniref:myo-inositol 2-dehydrogenase-like n=1 Tax=Anneissia japonica TaxID=1529436 RepID=UPI001425ABB5